MSDIDNDYFILVKCDLNFNKEFFVRSLLKISICTSVFINLPLFANEDKLLPEVKVVSATGFEQNIKDAPATLSVITHDALEKRNHKDVESMAKVNKILYLSFTLFIRRIRNHSSISKEY